MKTYQIGKRRNRNNWKCAPKWDQEKENKGNGKLTPCNRMQRHSRNSNRSQKNQLISRCWSRCQQINWSWCGWHTSRSSFWAVWQEFKQNYQPDDIPRPMWITVQVCGNCRNFMVESHMTPKLPHVIFRDLFLIALFRLSLKTSKWVECCSV